MGRPRVILKLATSLDGRIALASGESRWITGEASRAEVQRLRAAAGFVMIGAGTARADNPSLLARTEPAPLRQPARVVVTSAFDIPAEGRLFQRLDLSPLIVFGTSGDGAKLRAAGAQLEQALDVGAMLERLAEIRAGDVLAEGGGRLAASLLAAGTVDRIEWFRAPLVLGGDAGPAIGDLALAALGDAHRWRRVALRELGPDIWESYEPA